MYAYCETPLYQGKFLVDENVSGNKPDSDSLQCFRWITSQSLKCENNDEPQTTAWLSNETLAD